MAAAEARALWQRTANRCFVQEDAKRAPKLACCQSSSSSSKQVDAEPTGEADARDHPAVGFMTHHRNPSFSNLPPDARWWLQLQPSYGYQKGLTHEQVNDLEAELDSLKAGTVNPPSENKEFRDIRTPCVGGNKNGEFFNCMNKGLEVKRQEVKFLHGKNAEEFLEVMDMKEKHELIEMDPTGCPKSQKTNEHSIDPESPWVGSEKTEPWWRTTDKDELASLVAQKSLDYFENCDLPPPQKMHVRRYPSTRATCFDHDEILSSSLDGKAEPGSFSPTIVHAKGCCNSEKSYERHRTSVEEGHQKCVSDESFSYSTTQKDENDPGKAQLLEALRHSQTRAREAEKMAKQAYAEKEHIIKLFFRQASQLFAYKQWFQLLQLETVYYQIKNKNQPMSTLFPVGLPWMPYKARKLWKSGQKTAKSKRGKRVRPRHDLAAYAVAFALGLSLVGAGLLLGWTVGWMLPF